jgi:small-conductance mechanosensitive channel
MLALVRVAAFRHGFFMMLNRNIDWQPIMMDLAAIAGALVVAELIHRFFEAAVRRATRKRGTFLADAILAHTSRPGRLLLMVIALSITLPDLVMPARLAAIARHLVEVGFIIGLAWVAIGFVEVFNSHINHRLPFDGEDNLRARRIRTQVQLLRQIVTGTIAFTALAGALMTFPNIRTLGAGLFASAGLAGLAFGMAARPALGNLIAGMQIAFTEPIRIDDVVIVEGEWGRIEELNTTYVVVRIWDLRRLIVPLTYFIEKPFQNWTRMSSDLIGTVFLYTDYTLPVEELRQEYQRILQASPLWDGKVITTQVTDFTEHSMQIRFLMSASNSSAAFDLRCYVREKLIDYLQKNHPGALPRFRADVDRTESPKHTLTSSSHRVD